MEKNVIIRYADQDDFSTLAQYDKHICEDELKRSIDAKRILVLFSGDVFAGWLRYNLFWDNMPFMNMLYFEEKARGKGYGGQLVSFWEQEMAKKGYKTLLVSTLSSEDGQHFFRKNGYVDCGALLLPGEPLEIILQKNLE